MDPVAWNHSRMELVNALNDAVAVDASHVSRCWLGHDQAEVVIAVETGGITKRDV